jgi:hypothetical protein
LIRAKAGWLLGLAQNDVEIAEANYRRTAIPAPTRAQPYPDPAAVAAAQGLERLSRAIGAKLSRISGQPVPENDRMTERYRKEAATLEALGQRDEQLIGQCELLRSMVAGRDGAWLSANLADLEGGLAAIDSTLRDRAALLMGRLP